MSFKNSRFKSLIRIDPKQILWLKKHNEYKTLAGFLDFIINNYKKHGHKKQKRDLPSLPKKDEENKEIRL